MDIVQQRRTLAARESYSYAAARGLVAKTWKCQKDRPERAVRTILNTLNRWCSSCDAIAGPDTGPTGPETRWRLTPKGQAAAEAIRLEAGR